MKTILVVSNDQVWLPVIGQFLDEINSNKTELIFERFENAFSRLEEDPDIGICAVDLTRFDATELHRLNDPEYNDPHPEEWQHPAIKLLRDIWCKFRHQKIIIGFYRNGLDERKLIKFKYKPHVVCPVGKLERKLNLQFKWIRWNLRGSHLASQN